MGPRSFPVWSPDQEQRRGNMHRIFAVWIGEDYCGDYNKAAVGLYVLYKERVFPFKLPQISDVSSMESKKFKNVFDVWPSVIRRFRCWHVIAEKTQEDFGVFGVLEAVWCPTSSDHTFQEL